MYNYNFRATYRTKKPISQVIGLAIAMQLNNFTNGTIVNIGVCILLMHMI